MKVRDIAVAFGIDVDKKSVKGAEDTIKGIKDTAKKLLGSLAIGFSLVKINALAEEFNAINDKIKSATKELGSQEEIQKKILKAANDTRMSYSATADVISKNFSTGLFKSVDEAVAFNDSTTKLFKTAAKTEAEITDLQKTLNKAFVSNAVGADMINQLLEKSPEAIKLLNKRFGTTNEQLKKMASSGKISASQLKDAFLNASDEINKSFDDLDYSISDAVLNIRNQWGLFCDSLWSGSGVANDIGKMMVKVFTSFMDLLKKIQPYIESLIKYLLRGLQKAFDMISKLGNLLGRIINKLGGIKQALKLAALAGAGIFLYLKADKIIGFLKSVSNLLGGIKPKMLIIVGLVILIALLIEDFINFMQGNDSLLGELLKKAGIDADGVRQKIKDTFTKIKDFLLRIWTYIKNSAERIFGRLRKFWEDNAGKIKDALIKVWTFIKDTAVKIFNGLRKFWENNGERIKMTLSAVWYNIKSVLKSVWTFIRDLAVKIFNGLKKFWDKWGDQIKAKFKTAFDFLLNIIKDVSDFVSGVFKNDWESAWEAVKSVLGNAIDFISDILGPIAPLFMGIVAAVLAYKAVLTVMTAAQKASTIATKAAAIGQKLLNAALSANPIGLVIAAVAALIAIFVTLWRNNEGFRNFFINTWNKIKDFFKALWEGISSAVSSVWETIKGVFTGAFEAIYNTVSSIFGKVRDFISNTISGMKDGISNTLNKIKETFRSIFEGIVKVVKAPVNGIIKMINMMIDALNGLSFDVPDWVPVIGGKKFGFNIPKIPLLAKGGIATKATHAIVGEGREKEAIMPLSKLGGMISGYIKEARETEAGKKISAVAQQFIGAAKVLTGTIKPSVDAVNKSTDNSRSITVNQTNQFTNTFNGDKSIQKNASDTAGKSADNAMEQMAKALKYLR